MPLIESAYRKTSRGRRSHKDDDDDDDDDDDKKKDDKNTEGETKIENTSTGYVSSTCLRQMPAIFRSGSSQVAGQGEYVFRACANQVLKENNQRLTPDVIKENVLLTLVLTSIISRNVAIRFSSKQC